MTDRPGSATDEFRVRCRDGVRLATEVYLPGARTSRVPAVLIRTPYGKRAPDSLLPFVADRLADAGYAVVVQDVRGRGSSGGVAEPFVRELYDAADTLDWLVAQGFSDDSVACWGNSYYGFTAWAAAATGHPTVRAVVSRYTSTDPASFTHDGGVLRLGPTAEWMHSTWTGAANETPVLDWSARPLSALVPARHLDGLRGASAEWDRIGRRVGAALGHLPTLHCVGWFDLFQRAQMREWRTVATHHDQFLTAAACDHMDDPWTVAGVGADQLLDPAARDAVLDRTLDPVIDFLHRQLRDGSGRPLPRVRWETAGAPGWQSGAAWPPEDVVRHTFGLSGPGDDGTLHDGAAPAGPAVQWDHDPDDLVPMIESDWWRPLLRQDDAGHWLGRAGVCSFTGSPVPEPLALAGPVELELSVRSTAPMQHLVTALCDVAPDGTSRLILQCAQRLPGSGMQVTLALGDTAYRLPAGHRLRLHLTSSCFPLCLPHSGSGADPFTTKRLTGSRQVLDASGARLIVTARFPCAILDPHERHRHDYRSGIL